jgi:hypothetical protein
MAITHNGRAFMSLLSGQLRDRRNTTANGIADTSEGTTREIGELPFARRTAYGFCSTIFTSSGFAKSLASNGRSPHPRNQKISPFSPRTRDTAIGRSGVP